MHRTSSVRRQNPLVRREASDRPRRKGVHPGIEVLEQRLMLDSSPAGIVVGRTLSSYFLGGVANSQESITYTVYNEQAEPVTGVLLTTTLGPDVTLRTASQTPDQD